MESVVKVMVIPQEEWQQYLNGQLELLRLLKEIAAREPAAEKVLFITVIESMQAVRKGRTKFDQLVSENKVKSIKKGRKIYVPIGEVERYFGER